MHRIILFGEVLADIFPGDTVLGGAPYNVTRHLHALQQQPVLISRAGNDALKTQLLAALAAHNITASGIQTDRHYPTGQVKVTIEQQSHHFDILANQAYDYIDGQEAASIAKLNKPDMTYFGTLAQREHASKTALKGILNLTTGPCFLDINLRAPWYNKATIHDALKQADHVKVSEEELATIAAMFSQKPITLTEAASLLTQQFELTTLFVTCGESGAWAVSKNGQTATVSGQAIKSNLVDTVGAGDAFSAMCILGLLNDWPLQKIIEQANLLAAEICKVRGAVPESEGLYASFLAN